MLKLHFFSFESIQYLVIVRAHIGVGIMGSHCVDGNTQFYLICPWFICKFAFPRWNTFFIFTFSRSVLKRMIFHTKVGASNFYFLHAIENVKRKMIYISFLFKINGIGNRCKWDCSSYSGAISNWYISMNNINNASEVHMSASKKVHLFHGVTFESAFTRCIFVNCRFYIFFPSLAVFLYEILPYICSAEYVRYRAAAFFEYLFSLPVYTAHIFPCMLLFPLRFRLEIIELVNEISIKKRIFYYCSWKSICDAGHICLFARRVTKTLFVCFHAELCYTESFQTATIIFIFHSSIFSLTEKWNSIKMHAG